MAATPARLTWAVDRLAVRPGHRVLEVGCGRGVAAELICRALIDGTLLAVDRSAGAVRAAEARNAAAVAAGRAAFRVVELAALDPADGPFDRILAVDVNLFWVGPPGVEYALLPRLLAPGGELHLCWQPPDPGRLTMIVDRVAARLRETGWVVTPAVRPDGPFCAVTAHRRG
ncbi:class I SAM-dependent methyltransferase [Micromonospora coxensis]|uniref:SAM-dependent methyltransferase n=1 Tax=Micromonospora coxensis TaxID=356852 RepID=UPI00343FCB08